MSFSYIYDDFIFANAKIIENIIIFTCIGIVEFLFFKHIILKYVPTY